MEITQGNYKAIITETTDGWGEAVFRVRVLCLSGSLPMGDVRFLKDYATRESAEKAAARELRRAA